MGSLQILAGLAAEGTIDSDLAVLAVEGTIDSDLAGLAILARPASSVFLVLFPSLLSAYLSRRLHSGHSSTTLG